MARFKLFAFSAVLLSLLYFGCSGTQPSGAENVPPAGQAQAPGEAPPALEAGQPSLPPESKQVSCELSLSPESVAAGSPVEISYRVSGAEGVKFTYLCGSQVVAIERDSAEKTGAASCIFTGSGRQPVWIKADGDGCALKFLEVRGAG